MSVSANEQQPDSGNAGQSDGAAVTASEVREAVNTQAQSQGVDASSMTPQQLVEMINALPDRIVDAIREATPARSTATQQDSSQAEDKTVERSKAGLFGGKSFAEWWTG
jgi:hypothetical protein